MTGVKLTERIRYLHCQDEDGSHGILVLASAYGYPTKVLEVQDQADFKFAYSTFVDIENRQAEMHRPARQLTTV